MGKRNFVKPEEGTYLDFNEFLDTIDNETVFVAAGGPFPDHSYITCSHPTVLERLSVCCFIVEIAQDHARGLDDQFSRFLVSRDLGTVRCHDSRLDRRKERA